MIASKIEDGQIIVTTDIVVDLVNGELPQFLKDEGWVLTDVTTNTRPSSEIYETVIEGSELVNGKPVRTYSKEDNFEDLDEFKEQSKAHFENIKSDFIGSVLSSEKFLRFAMGDMSATEEATYKTETLATLNGYDDDISDVDDATNIQGVKDVF